MFDSSASLVIQLTRDLSPAVPYVDTEAGRVFINYAEDRVFAKGEFILVLRGDKDVVLQVYPSGKMESGYRRIGGHDMIVSAAIEAGICTGFVPRNFHAIVNEALNGELEKQYNECPYGQYVTLKDESIVLVASESPIEAGTLVEVVRAKNNVLVVRAAKFVSAEPFVNDEWAEFITTLLKEEKPKMKGELKPRRDPEPLRGIWVGQDLTFLNNRDQRSCFTVIDGIEEGTTARVYFTRNDETPDLPLLRGTPVEVTYTGGANVALRPYKGISTRMLNEDDVIGHFDIRLHGEKPRPKNGARVVHQENNHQAVEA